MTDDEKFELLVSNLLSYLNSGIKDEIEKLRSYLPADEKELVTRTILKFQWLESMKNFFEPIIDGIRRN